jgi:hypothetical protein
MAKPPANHVTKAEKELRLADVAALRIKGARLADIVTLASQKGWGVKAAALKSYIAQADALLRKECGRGLRKQVEDHRVMRRYLYHRAVETNQIQTAITILDSDAKLAGLFPKDDFKEVIAQIADFEKKIAEMGPRLKAYEGKIAELEAEIAKRDRQKTAQPGS